MLGRGPFGTRRGPGLLGPAGQAPPYDDPPQPTAAAGVAGVDEDGVLSRLERLGTLQRQGVLSPEEFSLAKAKILAG